MLKRTYKRWFQIDGSDVSFLMLHSTRHRISLTTVKPLLSLKLWRLSPWHWLPERRFNKTSKNAPMISIWSIQAPRWHKFSSLMVNMADTSIPPIGCRSFCQSFWRFHGPDSSERSWSLGRDEKLIPSVCKNWNPPPGPRQKNLQVPQLVVQVPRGPWLLFFS